MNKIRLLVYISLALIVVFAIAACGWFDEEEDKFDAPERVEATLQSNGTIYVSWTEVKGAKRYTIAYKIDKNLGKPVEIDTIKETEYIHRSLPSGVQASFITYYVKALNSEYSYSDEGKESDWAASNEVDLKSY